jgi:hypothetical protein
MRIFQILLTTLFFSFFFNIEKSYAIKAAEQSQSVFFQQKIVKDSIVITAKDAEKAFKSAKKFYDNIHLYFILSILVSMTGGIISLAVRSNIQKDWEKAFLYYDAIEDKEKVAQLRKMIQFDNALFTVALISALLPLIFLIFFIILLFSFLSAGLNIALLSSVFLGSFFLGFALFFDKTIFKTKNIF